MIVGTKQEDHGKPFIWFAWYPVQLEDGRWAWWEYVLKIRWVYWATYQEATHERLKAMKALKGTR